MRILVIGLSRDLPLGPADAMELADHLVKRAAAVQADGETVQSSSQQVVPSGCVCSAPLRAEAAPAVFQRASASLRRVLILMAKHLAHSQLYIAVAFSLEQILIFSYRFCPLLVISHWGVWEIVVLVRMRGCDLPPTDLSYHF